MFVLCLMGLVSGGTSIPSASASDFKAGAYPADLLGSQLAAKQVVFVFPPADVKCETATLSNPLAAASTAVTLHPLFGGCTAFGEKKEGAVVTTGCDFVFRAGANVVADLYKGSLDVVCAAGKSIKIAAQTCVVEIKSQNGLQQIELVDNTVGIADLEVKLGIAKLSYTVAEKGIFCPLPAAGNFNNGTIAGSYTVTATAGGSETKIEVL